VSATIYVEGGGDSPELQARCREGMRKLLVEKCGFAGRRPRLFASGGREAAFDDFRTAHKNGQPTDYVAMLIDSEDPVADVEAAWAHLAARDKWQRPAGASDEQVLLMVTGMETWIVTDRAALARHYGKKLQESALPARANMGARQRHAVQAGLVSATRKCANAYAKGKRSFEVLAELDPAVLAQHLPSFVRVVRILNESL
jgi:hypothetical protein